MVLIDDQDEQLALRRALVRGDIGGDGSEGRLDVGLSRSGNALEQKHGPPGVAFRDDHFVLPKIRDGPSGLVHDPDVEPDQAHAGSKHRAIRLWLLCRKRRNQQKGDESYAVETFCYAAATLTTGVAGAFHRLRPTSYFITSLTRAMSGA